MQNPTKKTIIPQIILSSLIAAAITAGIVSAASTIGANISTTGTLTVSGVSTFNGNVTLGDNASDIILSTGTLRASSTLQSTGAARLYSTLRVDGNTTFNTVTYTWPASDGSSGQFLSTDGSGTMSWASASAGGGTLNYGGANSLAYYSSAGTTATGTTDSLLYWNNTNARLGIGTTSPYAKLSVVGETVAEYFTATSTAATSTLSGGLAVGSNALNVLQNGNVGIGTAAPSVNLHIYQDSPTANQILFQIGTSDDSSRFSIDEDGDMWTDREITAGGDIAVMGDDVYRPSGSIKLSGGNDVYITMDYGNSSSARAIRFGHDSFSSPTELMRIQEDGFVGIGTTTPTVSLQVATSTANATTTMEVGKASQNKGTCLKLYDAAGAVVYCSVTSTGFSCTTTSCE